MKNIENQRKIVKFNFFIINLITYKKDIVFNQKIIFCKV